MQRALEGIRVIELARYLAGPHAGMILADLGAEVIKVEPPEGEFTRHSGEAINGQTVYFMTGNRNKKSIVLDVKQPGAREVLYDLVKVSDVVLDNFRPGVMAHLGLDYETLCRINPRIISCSVSGYGATGPYRGRPAYDYLLQGWAGVAHMIGNEDGPPMSTRLSVIDLLGGIHGALGILAAVEARHRTGVGQFVDIALLDGAWSLLSYHVASYLTTGRSPARPAGSAHPVITPSQIFQTADSYLIVIALDDDFFIRLCQVLGLPEVADDPRFASFQLRSRHRDALIPLVQERFLTRTTDEWMADLIAADIPSAPVNDVGRALQDPQILARGAVVTCHHPVAGPVPIVGNPIKLSRNDEVFEPAPLLGQHTREVLVGLLGYSEERLRELVEAGLCAAPDQPVGTRAG